MYPDPMDYPYTSEPFIQPMSNYYPTYMPPMPYKKRGIPLDIQTTLRTAQKAIFTMNQLIPVIYQVRPILHNAKTAFRVIKAVKQMDLDSDPYLDQEIDEALQNTQSSASFENML